MKLCSLAVMLCSQCSSAARGGESGWAAILCTDPTVNKLASMSTTEYRILDRRNATPYTGTNQKQNKKNDE